MAAPIIQGYRFGRMVVDGVVHHQDLLLLPERVVPGWWRQQGHRLALEDLEAAPDVLVVGTGASGVMEVPALTRRSLADAGIELVVLPTTEAWQRYNELSSRRRTAGAFHLTC
jgi:hypothetical protein